MIKESNAVWKTQSMNWIKSVFARKAPDPDTSIESPEAAKVYDMGRKASEDMCGDLDTFISQHFLGVKERYIGVLQDALNSAKSSKGYSPAIAGKIDFQLFCENIEKLKSKMLNETHEHMSKWNEFFAVLEMEGYMKKIIEQTVKNFTEDVFFAGLRVFRDNADELKDADDAWRRANPELAAAQPLDDRKQ